MKKRPFLIFAAVIGILTSGIIWFIQSPQFARILKSTAAKYLPADPGIEGDFSEFAIKLFPPGVSIRNPKLLIRKKNIANLPAGSSINAERIDLNFRPFQMFSGTIQVHEVVVVNGDVHLAMDQSSMAAGGKKRAKVEFHWDELLQIHAEAVALENTRVNLQLPDSAIAIKLLAETLRVAQSSGRAGPGYDLFLDLKELSGRFPKGWIVPDSLDELKAAARVDAGGLRVTSFGAKRNGLDIGGTGTIKGNLLSSKSALATEASLSIRGDLRAALGFVPGKHSTGELDSDLDGAFSFEGKVKGDLQRVLETFRADGVLLARNARFKKWHAEQARIEASWVASHGGGELSVSKGLITAPETPRRDGTPASGGRIEIGAFKTRLSPDQSFSIPLKLESAHIHWLAAPAIQDVFGLDFRTSGQLALNVTPPVMSKSWVIRGQTDLTVDSFSLDNQRLGKKKPLNTVLKIQKIKLDGEVDIDSTGVMPSAEKGLTLALPHTRLKLSGKVDFRNGYDLHATGPVSLGDLGQIAGNEIRGDGTLNAHVHGPASRVILDFDTDLKEAYYLRLRLGHLKGRITYDEDPQHLIFTNAQVQKGQTSYIGNGSIAFADPDSVALKFQVPQGNIQDFIQIFHELVGDLWWFPRTLNGAVDGQIEVSGGLAMDRLKVSTHMKGRNWEHLGERFTLLDLTGGFDRGTYHLSDARLTKRTGRLAGRISYDDNRRKIDWDFKTEDFTVLDFDHLAQLDVPVRGRLSISSAGHGIQDSVSAETRISLTSASVRGVLMPPSQLILKNEAGVLRCSGIALGGQGILEMAYDFRVSGPGFFRAEFKQLDFSPLLLLLNPKLSQDRSLAALASGAVNMSFRSGEADRGTGTVELTQFHLRKSNTRFELERPASIKVTDGSFDVNELSLKGNQGHASFSLRGRKANLDGAISGALDVSVLEFLTSSVAQATGTAALDFSLGGSIKAPTILGEAKLDGITLRVPSIESPFENIAGKFQVRQNVLSIENLEADLAGGRISSNGTIQVFADRYPSLSIKGNVQGSKLKIYPFQFVKARGSLHVHGDELPYMIDGAMTLDSALSREKVFNQKQGEGLKAAEYMPPPTSKSESNYPKFKLNIDVKADRGILIQNDLFDAELRGRVTAVNTLETPRILGTAELVQGNMIFKNRIFHIQSASATFDNPTVINPAFNLTASTDVNNTKIQLYASGRIEKWKIELSSNPVMPESEILSLLALGISPTDVKKLGASDRSVVEQGEAASLLLHSLDFNREVQSKTGFQIQLGESLDSQTGTSIARPQLQSESSAAPKIVIKKQIGTNLDLSYGSTVGIGTNNRKEVNAEYRVTPGFSLIGVWDNYETVDAQEKKSYGMDFKWQKRFK
ncbi:MAG TPA: translocation/assembly module TamB domain-containing protein [Bdellovibrionota bacterium]|nr:translocation/assembly module TamB domain-containing protein [Bdellovibrionota bacterium]